MKIAVLLWLLSVLSGCLAEETQVENGEKADKYCAKHSRVAYLLGWFPNSFEETWEQLNNLTHNYNKVVVVDKEPEHDSYEFKDRLAHYEEKVSFNFGKKFQQIDAQYNSDFFMIAPYLALARSLPNDLNTLYRFLGAGSRLYVVAEDHSAVDDMVLELLNVNIPNSQLRPSYYSEINSGIEFRVPMRMDSSEVATIHAVSSYFRMQKPQVVGIEPVAVAGTRTLALFAR